MILALLPSWLSANGLISLFGDFAVYGVVAVIFAECGLLIGIVFPGDSLLFAVGMLTATGLISTPLPLTLALLVIAAVSGNVTGHWIGERVGPRIFTSRARFFKREYVERTEHFFARYGNRAIIFARFVPVVRTLITMLAGVGHMDRARFVRYSAIGGLIWVVFNVMAGYWLGSIAFIRDHLEVSLLIIVVVSWIPILIEAERIRREERDR